MKAQADFISKIKDHSLYLVISEEYGCGRKPFEIAQSAISGGADIIQMREKNKSRKELVDLGNRLSRLCKDNCVTFIVNDDPGLVKEVDADGVHLGQEDMKRISLEKARSIIGKDRIIGVSTHSINEFEKANDSDVDYIAFGPIFPTKTKDYHIGTSGIKSVIKSAKHPIFFIGGINLENLGSIMACGAKNIALIRGILEAENIEKETKRYKKFSDKNDED